MRRPSFIGLVVLALVLDQVTKAAALAMLDQGLVPDLLVTDHLMPGMTGTDLAREVHARLGEVPTLIVSGYADVEGLGRDFAHLPKPFRQADLARALTLLGVR